MTNNQIHYMVEIAKAGSVNQAARNLFISQSSLSGAIQSVEAEFGRKIFARSVKGMALTPFGRQFIAYITPIDRQLQQLYSMRMTAVSAQESLSVISNGFYYLSDIVTSMGQRRKDSGLHVFLREEYSGNVADAVMNGEADIAVVRIWSCYRDQLLERFLSSNLLYHPLCSMELGVDVGPMNPFFRSQDVDLLPEQLAGYPQIIDESLDYGPYADILSKLGLQMERTRYVVISRAAIYEILSKTDGYVLNSRKETNDGKVKHDSYEWRFLPFRNCSITSEIGWVRRENSVLTPEAKEFIHLLQNHLLLCIGCDYNI